MQDAILFDDNFAETEVTVDSAQLTEVVKNCFLLSMDGRLSSEMQGLLHALGSRLRTQLRELLSKVFDEGTPGLLTANANIEILNRDLKRAKADIDRVANIIGGLGALAKQLDELLKIAGVII